MSVEKQNDIVKAWVPKVRRMLINSARTFPDGKTEPFVMRGTRVEKKLSSSIASRTRKSYGEIDTITFSFERHGVFVHKGVGRGHPISNPRTAFEWFNPVLDKRLPELANSIAAVNADAVLNATRIKIQ